MKVAIRYMAQLRRAAGTAVEQVELDGGDSVGALLTHLAERHGSLFRNLLLDRNGVPHRAVLVFVGDEQIGPEKQTLCDGDVVTVLTPMAGG